MRYREWLPVVEIDGERAFVYFLDEPPSGGRCHKVRACDNRPLGGKPSGTMLVMLQAPVPGQRSRPPDRRCRSASLALSPGPDAGPEDGQGAHLLAGDRRLHQHQRDPDPARPLELRQVRQARRRVLDRLAALGDPQDPPHAGPAQHRPRRCGAARPGDRELGDLRRARHQHRSCLRRGRVEDRPSRSARRRSTTGVI